MGCLRCWRSSSIPKVHIGSVAAKAA
jgi:hypothetical protein